MAFGLNGNGTGQGALQKAADNAALAVLARLAMIALVGVVGFLAPRVWDNMADTAAINEQQNLALQKINGAMDLMVYRLDEAEKVNRQQERHFRATDSRVSELERQLPPPARPGWPYYEGEE